MIRLQTNHIQEHHVAEGHELCQVQEILVNFARKRGQTSRHLFCGMFFIVMGGEHAKLPANMETYIGHAEGDYLLHAVLHIHQNIRRIDTQIYMPHDASAPTKNTSL